MASSDPRASIVVPTHGRPERLRALLDSLARQSLDPSLFEVIVVADDPTDETRATIEAAVGSLPIELRALDGSAARGPAAARNRGWREARAELVAFIDDDCEATETWLERGLAAAEANPGAIIQGRTGPNPRELDRLGPFSRTIQIDGPSPFFQTCNIFYPRTLLEQLGGFDERFTEAAGEDADLGWRALGRGARWIFDQQALVHHAVEDLGPRGLLSLALRGVDTAWTRKRYPGLRAAVTYGWIFRRKSHAQLALALAGLALARRFRPAALLALPYLRSLLGRSRARGGAVWVVPFLLLYDGLDTYKAVRGSITHRVWML